MLQSSLKRLLSTPSHHPEQSYLLGLRGFLVLQSFVWVFLQTFAPTAVKDSANTSGPSVQVLIRKTLSVLFWNESLLYSWFIILSARTICIPFIKNPTGAQVANLVFRRGVRLCFPTAVALAIVQISFSSTEHTNIADFKNITSNVSIEIPYKLPNALAYFNSVFNLFWITRNFSEQSGSTAFPSQTLWIVNVLYSQGYTVFLTMVMIPYTRNSWRVRALLGFILTAWWVQSWAWYSVSGLLLADVIMNMDFKTVSQKGIHVWRSIHVPSWILYTILMGAGLVMQYLWTDWRPEWEDRELGIHTGVYYTGGLNTNYNVSQPQARDDNYLFIVGFLLLLETSDFLQYIFKNPLFRYLGRRSLSWFLIQSIIIYTFGIRLFLHLHITKSWPEQDAVVACLAVCLVSVVPAAEFFYRVIDVPSRVLAEKSFDWVCD